MTFDYIDSSKEFLVKITCVNKGQFPVAQVHILQNFLIRTNRHVFLPDETIFRTGHRGLTHRKSKTQAGQDLYSLLFQYTDDSTLTALTAEVFIDEHNNRYVNLTISGGGTIKVQNVLFLIMSYQTRAFYFSTVKAPNTAPS